MHEATVTIIKKNPPGQGKKMWELVAETGERFKAFNSEADLFDEGKRYRLHFESKEYNGFAFNSIKGAPKLIEQPAAQAKNPAAGDIGPHIGMWEKIVSELLNDGMSEEAIPAHIILCRRLARAGLRADLDAKLPDLKPGYAPGDDPNDSLEF